MPISSWVRKCLNRQLKAVERDARRAKLRFDALEDRLNPASLLSIGDAQVTEGNSGNAVATFTVSLDTPSVSTITVNYSLAVGGTASAGDLIATSGTLTFAPGELTRPLAVQVVGDTAMERDETFVVNLTSPTNAGIYDNFGLGTIMDDDLQAVYTTPTGPLDITYGTAGKVTTAMQPSNVGNLATGMQRDSNGRIVLFGNTLEAFGQLDTGVKVVRYNPNGQLDTSFNGTGIVKLQPFTIVGGYDGAIYQSGPNKDKIIVVGTMGRGGPHDLFLTRLNIDGSLDTTFGNIGLAGPGYVNIDVLNGQTASYGVAIYESGPFAGRFLVVGTINASTIAVTRHLSNGSLDSSFGVGGKLFYQTASNGSISGEEIRILAGDKILIGGSATNPVTASADSVLVRLTSSGALDTTFNGNGYVHLALNTVNNNDTTQGGLSDIAVQADGKIVVVGGAQARLGIARVDTNGHLDPTFNGTGYRFDTPAAGQIIPGRFAGVGVSDDGKIFASGYWVSTVNGGYDYVVARYNADGSVDANFDPIDHDGLLFTNIAANDFSGSAMSDANNDILAAGYSGNGLGDATFSSAKFEAKRSDMSVTMTASPAHLPLTGGTVTFTIHVRATGDDAVFASLRDILPAGVTFISMTRPTGWVGSTPAIGSNGTIIAATRTLRQSDGDQVFTLTVVLDGAVFALNDITNTITVASAIVDANSANNTTSTIVTPPCPATPANLVSWWKADGNAIDSIGTNNGVLQNGATFTAGKVNQSFSLDGVDDAIQVGGQNLGAAYSLEMWVMPTVDGSVFRHLVSNDWRSANFGALYFIAGQLSYWQNGTNRVGTPTGSVPLNVWSHVALTYDGSVTRLYVNGVLKGTSGVHSASFNNPLSFGYTVNPSDNHFKGNLDEVSLYNRALSAAELLSIYQARGAGKCVNTSPVAAADLVTLFANGSKFIQVLSNDHDPDEDDVISVVSATAPSHGQRTINADGTITYTPTPGYVGLDSFTYTIQDDHGAPATTTVSIVVKSVAITGAPASSPEGTAISLGSSITNAGTAESHTLNWSVTKAGNAYASGSGSNFTFTPNDNSSYVVTLTATDDDGDLGTTSATISVSNVAPALTISGAGSIAEGSPYTLSLASSDPGADTIDHSTITWGDGNIQTISGNASSVTHTYADGPSNYSIAATATDEDGTFSANAISVSVNNVAPTLTISGAGSINEGSPYTLSLTSNDPGIDTIDHWTLAWGDGNVETINGNPSSVNHTYVDGANTFTISATATDADGTYDADTVSVSVNNVAPTLTISGAGSTNEGSPYTLSLVSSDSGADTIDHWIITWGDGSVETISGHPSSVNHTYADGPNNFTISATATDGDGTFGANTVSISVNNVAPTLTISGVGSVIEGSPYALSLASSAPGVDTIEHWIITWGDGDVETISGNPSSVSHTYADGPNYFTISATATDEDGSYDANTVSVSENNVAPTLTISGSSSVNEGALYTLTLAVNDPGVDTISGWEIFWGEGPAEHVPGNPSSVTHIYADGSSTYTISATAIDEDGMFASNLIGVAVISHASTALTTPTVPAIVNINQSLPTSTVLIRTSAPTGNVSGAAVVYNLTRDSDGAVVSTLTGTTDTSGISRVTFSGTALTVAGNYTIAANFAGDAALAVATSAPAHFLLNSPPVAADDSETTTEDGAVTLGVLGNDTDAENNIDPAQTVHVTAPASGTLTDYHDGTFMFDTGTAFQYLPAGQAALVPFEYRVFDAFGEHDDGTVQITVIGVNDGATIAGTSTGAVTEDVAPGTAGSTLTVSDVDAGENVFQAPASLGGTYGGFTFNPTTGAWSYQLDNTKPAVQALAAEQVAHDTLTVKSKDGTATHMVDATVNGTNDVPTVVMTNTTVTVNEGQTAGNSGSFSDVDLADRPTLSASVGTITQDANNTGSWSWSLDMHDGPGETQTVTITADDHHGGIVTKTFGLTVDNVAPTGTLTSGNVTFGTAAAATFSGPFDPSTTDTSAGFHYAFAIDDSSLLNSSTYANSGTVKSFAGLAGLAVGSHTIFGKILDKDGGATIYPVPVKVTLAVGAGYILNPTASAAVNASGNATVNLPLGLYVASNSSTAVTATGNARVEPNNTLQVVGGVSRSGNAVAVKTGVPAATNDPLANLPLPPVAGTTYGTVSLSGNGAKTLNPGVYTSIQISGNVSATMTPGRYLILSGGFTVSGNASVTGTGVFIFNAGSAYNGTTDGGTYGAITLGGNGTVNLNPITTAGDPYAGILIFQSRSNTKVLNLSGSSSATTSGTIYAPAAQLAVSGNGTLHDTLVVNTLYVSGNAGAFQLVEGASSDYAVSTSNMLTNPILTVGVQDDTGVGLDPTKMEDLDASMNYLNAALAQFGVSLSWATDGVSADVHLHFAATTPQGGAADGVLGFTTADNDVYFAAGWNMYTGQDPAGIGAGQYDFLTLATHELAHTVGLGESSDPSSVMYMYLAPGTVRREFTGSNLALINTDADRFMKAGGAWSTSLSPLPILHPAALIVPSGLPSFLFADALGAEPSRRPVVAGPTQAGPAAAVLVGGDGTDFALSQSARDVLVGGFGQADTRTDEFDQSTDLADWLRPDADAADGPR